MGFVGPIWFVHRCFVDSVFESPALAGLERIFGTLVKKFDKFLIGRTIFCEACDAVAVGFLFFSDACLRS